MKIISSYDIFEASYYLSTGECSFEKALVTQNGSIGYHILCRDKQTAEKLQDEFLSGKVLVNLQTYLWEFRSLYRLSCDLKGGNEGFQGGSL